MRACGSERVEWVYEEVYSSRRDLACSRCGATVDHLIPGVCGLCTAAINLDRARGRRTQAMQAKRGPRSQGVPVEAIELREST